MATQSGDHARARALLVRAIEAGAERLSLTRLRWNISNGCENALTRDLPIRTAKSDAPSLMLEGLTGPLREVRSDLMTLTVLELVLPCRTCPRCLWNRGRLWRLRGKAELDEARDRGCRSWFCSFTFRPFNHYKITAKAAEYSARRGIGDFETLTPHQQFRLREQFAWPEVCKYLKRVRKNTGTRFRYVIVCEPHTKKMKNHPHYHALLHECDELAPVKYDDIRENWGLGHVAAELVTDDGHYKSASYVAKYISKTLTARVRASIGYGKHVLEPSMQLAYVNKRPSKITTLDLWKLYNGDAVSKEHSAEQTSDAGSEGAGLSKAPQACER